VSATFEIRILEGLVDVGLIRRIRIGCREQRFGLGGSALALLVDI